MLLSRFLRVGFLTAVFLILLVFASPVDDYFGQEIFEVTEVESEVVCSPGTHRACLPGPFSETVTVPPEAGAVRIDVYWVWVGLPDSLQPNENSWFFVAVNNVHSGQIFCPDQGDGVEGNILCGSVNLDVSPGDEVTLTIQHADEQRGPTPGSHHQLWQLNWFAAPAPEPPVDTPTSTPEEPAPTPEEPTPETPTATPIPPLPPVGTPTPTAEEPAPTPEEPTPETPTATSIPPLPPVGTPTPTAEEPTPVGPTLPAPTPTPVQPLPPPPGVPTETPTFILPVTGGDHTSPLALSSLSDLSVEMYMVIAGLALMMYAIMVYLRR